MNRAAVLIALALLGAAPATRLDLQVQGLRSEQGLILVCLVRDKSGFPDCSDDPTARHAVIVAAEGGIIRFDNLPSGAYAAALIHDENGNRKLDRRLGIPIEGIGFSRNPKFFFGPPSFRSARFEGFGPQVEQPVKLRYFL